MGYIRNYNKTAQFDAERPGNRTTFSRTEVTGSTLNRYNAWAAIRKTGQSRGFSHPCRMSHLAGNRHHDLRGERRPARARPADGRP
jgi:hypothetical protein